MSLPFCGLCKAPRRSCRPHRPPVNATAYIQRRPWKTDDGLDDPEIQRTNPGAIVLQLKAMGINDLLGFDFGSAASTVFGGGSGHLYRHDLDDDGLLTRSERWQSFPWTRLRRNPIISTDLGCAEEILTVTRMLSVESPSIGLKTRPRRRTPSAPSLLIQMATIALLLIVYQAWMALSALCREAENFIWHAA